ncbi:hypothetical protein [Streptomyces luteogriseus]|uniref:hypothetical protein n=1 Tax=Streptomyces luteogriseus TaxID=68233 RepID=UPI0027D77EDC|nr:hypothetical protein [Streptomyces luteogriseus]
MDNKDGTISLFITLIESAAPHRTDFAHLAATKGCVPRPYSSRRLLVYEGG